MQSPQQRTGVTIAVVSAVVLLFASVGLAWFGIQGATLNGQELGIGGLAVLNVDIPGGSLWETTSFLDILVFVCCVGTIVIGGRALGGAGLSEIAATIVAVLGIVALVLIVYVAIAPPNNIDLADAGLSDAPIPGGTEEPIQVELSREIGVFVGVLAALGMTIGGGMAARRGPAGSIGRAPSRRPSE